MWQLVKATVVETTAEHVKFVAENMRKPDKREIWLSHRIEPLEALEMITKQYGPQFTGMHGDEPVAIFGILIVNDLNKTGSPWMLATDKMMSRKKDFAAISKEYMAKMAEQFNYLENYVHKENRKSVRWLKWLGFEVHKPIPYGISGAPFHKFTMRIR